MTLAVSTTLTKRDTAPMMRWSTVGIPRPVMTMFSPRPNALRKWIWRRAVRGIWPRSAIPRSAVTVRVVFTGLRTPVGRRAKRSIVKDSGSFKFSMGKIWGQPQENMCQASSTAVSLP